MRYFLEVHTLTCVELHAIPKKDCVKFWAEHKRAINIDQEEYNRLLNTAQNTSVS